jgi:predicted nucleotide-binding protein
VSADLAAELTGVAARLRGVVERGEADGFAEPLHRFVKVVDAAGAAWSDSPVGYHARVYYRDSAKPPPGARFSSEWGFMPAISNEMAGQWQEYDFDEVRDHIVEAAQPLDIPALQATSTEARESVETAKGEIESILAAYTKTHPDELAEKLREQASAINALSEQQIQQASYPRGSIMSRDAQAMGEGIQLAPHLVVQAKAISLKAPFQAAKDLATVAARAGDHISRLGRVVSVTEQAEGDRVFIGHGRSAMWRELKDFVQDRLGLPYDEFNRVPVAGVTNIKRLAEMLDTAAIALLVLTAEDERIDGAVVARQNVVPEAGLFQGRLGFERAIVLLEEGCEEFSNIAGLGQIRFPTGGIAAAFEEVRRVLEREGLVDT